ncbi:polysaccharide pyruvyl transferase family protein [Eubacterium sp.]
MAKKIAIITIPDYNNYGNRLQNYAVRVMFSKMGFDVYTLEMNDNEFKSYKARKYKLLLKKYNMKPFIFLFNVMRNGFLYARRENFFEKFTRRFLKTKYYPEYNDKIIKKIDSEYEYFVFGSDQIWNPFINDSPNLYFGLFTKVEKRIYYAPSFGVEKIDNDYSKEVSAALKDAKNISVREESGRKIISDVLDKDSEVLIDPTLMLDAKEWKEIARVPSKFPTDEYILSCFLGPKSQEYRNILDDVKNSIECDNVYSIADKSTYGYLTGPSEFIYSIQNAKFVITDSFHATVFAILFNKPFLVLSRLDKNGNNARMDSRIDTLLKKFNLSCRKYNGTEIDYLKCDFSFVERILQEERKKAIRFINRTIEGK